MESTLIINCSNGMRLHIITEHGAEFYFDETKNRHSDDILKVIDELLIKLNLNIRDIKNICVCVGPGSFTGIRVAISVCKGLSIGVGANIFTLTNFDVFNLKENNYILILNAFSNYVYIRKCLNGKNIDDCVEISSLKCEINNHNFKVYCEDEKLQNLLKINKIHSEIVKIDEFSSFLVPIANNDFKEISTVLPIYLRASQAEIEREKKDKRY